MPESKSVMTYDSDLPVEFARAADSLFKRASGAWTSETFVLMLMSSIWDNRDSMHNDIFKARSKPSPSCQNNHSIEQIKALNWPARYLIVKAIDTTLWKTRKIPVIHTTNRIPKNQNLKWMGPRRASSTSSKMCTPACTKSAGQKILTAGWRRWELEYQPTWSRRSFLTTGTQLRSVYIRNMGPAAYQGLSNFRLSCPPWLG